MLFEKHKQVIYVKSNSTLTNHMIHITTDEVLLPNLDTFKLNVCVYKACRYIKK